MTELMSLAAKAIDDVARKMDAERYKLPAHKREKYFGSYKEKLLNAQARAVIDLCVQVVMENQETVTETGHGSHRHLTPRMSGNLMGLAYARGIEELKVKT